MFKIVTASNAKNKIKFTTQSLESYNPVKQIQLNLESCWEDF
jgi:hypothetical protein